ncbi:MAG TPA: hypothetical protein VE826_11060 [Dongiaceae bacterium]|nr:hypothetical protein [Dongiaceae bacterium]
MDARSFAWRVSLALTALALAACGGGGGGGSSALPPTSTSLGSAGAPPPGSAPASVAFTVAVPSASTSSAARRARYVSAGTKSVAVSYSGGRQTADCTATCTLTLAVNAGTMTFDVGLYDAPGGTGHVLSSGTTSATVVSGQVNTIKVTFAGVVAKVAVGLGTSTVSAGSAASVPVTVSALDAAGYTIVGPEPYQNPIALSLDDASGATSLSASSVSAPGAAVTLAYNGSAAVSAVHVSANAGAGIVVQPATLTVQPASAPPPSGGAGSAPVHVKTFAYYGINGMDADVPAAYMAAHVDMVEDDGFTAQHADAFKRAGGALALAYTDPSYVPHCPPPFTAPAGTCEGPIGNLVANDESAFVHGANGERVRRYNDPYFQYQEVLNAGAASAQHAYAQTTAAILSHSPLLDGFEADDSGSTFSGDSLGSNLFWGFNAPGVEYASDEQYIAGESAMLKAAGKPVLINGGDPSTLGPAYGGRFLDQPNVLGAMFEGCFNNESGPYTDRSNLFLRETNGYLSALPHHKIALCSPTGDTAPAHRLYAYAAFMLVYDQAYSYYGMVANQSDNESLYPETELVPQQPAKTASTIDQLKSGGVYVRQFAACSIAGSAIGPCAAVVNPSSSASASIPAMSVAYAHSIALDAQSLYHGGKTNVVAGAPTSLPPASAAILVR